MMQSSPELAAWLTGWYEQFTTGNGSSVASFMSTEDGTLGLGTDPREWWSGPEVVANAWRTQLPEMNAAGMKFVQGETEAWTEGSVGWFADPLTIKMPDGTDLPARLTGVCHQEGGTWKCVQFHLSFGAMNEEAIGEHLTI